MTKPGHGEIHPQWSHLGNSTQGQSPWPSHDGREPMLGTRSMCHCRPPIGGEACYQLGQSPERGPDVEHSVGLAEGTEADKSEDASGKHASSEEGKLILWNQQNLMIHWGVLYLCSMSKGKIETSCCLSSPRHAVLPLWMGATEMHAIKGVTTCCPCCENTSGGQEWLTRCKNPWGIAHIACSMRANYPKCPYTWLCPLIQWISCYVDFISIEMTMELNRLPKVVNILVFQDHFMLM